MDGAPASDEVPMTEQAVRRWVTSGAAALTGRPDGPPLGPPQHLVPRSQAVATRLAAVSSRIGRPVGVDPVGLITERAALMGLRRRGTVSAGGAGHLMRGLDGWLAISLARDSDRDLVPAWLAPEPIATPEPSAVAEVVAASRVADLVGRGAELGLPVSELGETVWTGADLPVQAALLGERRPTTDLSGVSVVELASLWAGPLCGSLLAAAGASVVKVEATRRPDGARRGSAPFFDLLNGDKRSVALDLTTTSGIGALRELIGQADVVIEGSRPRALRQMGVEATDVLRSGAGVWVSITGHGRGPDAGHRVGFGDDAAVAGGLVAWEGGEPRFVADAVADPLAGLVAAAAALEALSDGGSWLLDVSLARVAAHHAGRTLELPADVVLAEPRAPRASSPAPPLGADTAAVLAEIEANR